MNQLAVKPFRVWLYQKAMAFGAALQSVPAKVTPPPFRLMQIGSLFWQSRALYVVTRLGLADALGDEEKRSEALASALNLHEDHLYRLMRMVASLGIFEETAPRVFRNSKSSQFLRVDHPRSVRAMILMHNSPEMTKPWIEALEACIRSGEVPFAEANGEELFDYLDHHREFDLLFSQAMDAVEGLTGNLFLDDFNWGAFERVIDVGGSKGSKSLAMLQAHPKLRAVVFDRPQIIEAARSHWRGKVSEEVLSRMEFVGGDMFESIPAAGSDRDLYLLFGIFHGMSDEECLKVLEKLKEAAGPHRPTVLFGDAVAEEVGIDPTIAAFDMQMLIGTRGRERTRREWTRLLERGGFELVEVLGVRAFFKFILARPAVGE